MNDVPGRNLPQNSKKVLQRVNDTYETVVVGVVTAPMGGDGEAVEAVAPVIGKKLLYMLGKATGRAHNIQRSLAMARQLSAICLHDSPQTRKYLTDHLINAFANPSNIARVEANGTIVRDSLLVGPGGVLKVESYWAGNQLKTFKLFGKR